MLYFDQWSKSSLNFSLSIPITFSAKEAAIINSLMKPLNICTKASKMILAVD